MIASTALIAPVTCGSLPVKSIEDAKTREVIVGATAPEQDPAMFPRLLNELLGTKFKVVLGYQGGNTIQLAMERGEVDGRAAVVWSGLKAGWPHWIAEKKVNVLLQTGLTKEKDLPDVPLLLDLAKTPEEKAIFRFVSSDSAIGFPVTAPPGIPADRLAALREVRSARGTKAPGGHAVTIADIAQRRLDLFLGRENYDNRINDDGLVDLEVLADLRLRYAGPDTE